MDYYIEILDMYDPSLQTFKTNNVKEAATHCGCSVGRIYEINREANQKFAVKQTVTKTVKRKFIVTCTNSDLIDSFNRHSN